MSDCKDTILFLNMLRKKKIISIPRGCVSKLAQDEGCQETMVYNALAFRSESERAQRIRKKALENYGGIYTYKVVEF